MNSQVGTMPPAAINRRLRRFSAGPTNQAQIEAVPQSPQPATYQAAPQSPTVSPEAAQRRLESISSANNSEEYISQQGRPELAGSEGWELVDDGTRRYSQRRIPNPALQPGYRDPSIGQAPININAMLNNAFANAGWGRR